MTNELIAAVLSVAGALAVWWITDRSRDRQEAKKERAVAEATLSAQSDALALAVIELRTAAKIHRALWEGPMALFQSTFYAMLAAAGGMAQVGADAPTSHRLFSAIGALGRTLGQDSRTAKARTSELKVEVSRLTAAGVPLLRHQNAAIRTATENLLMAATAFHRNEAATDAAMVEFNDAIRTMLPSWSAPI